jgi:hypothetical protein
MITNTDLKGTAMPAPIVAEVGQSPTTFEFDIAHHVPGRLRLRSAALKRNICASERALGNSVTFETQRLTADLGKPLSICSPSQWNIFPIRSVICVLFSV